MLFIFHDEYKYLKKKPHCCFILFFKQNKMFKLTENFQKRNQQKLAEGARNETDRNFT